MVLRFPGLKEQLPCLALVENDSAWEVYEKLPAWARQAAAIVAGFGGSVRIRVLAERGYSSQQLRQMARGPHQILLASRSIVKLTNLGRKIAAIGEERRSEDSAQH